MGGDAREREVIAALAASGAVVPVAARPPGEPGATWYATVGEALAGASALILPLPGVDARGRVHAPLVADQFFISVADLERLLPGAPILVGSARPCLSEPAARLGHPLVELADDDELAIYNSIPTAEGAIQMAMERRPITIHDSRAVVIGLGRCGTTLARTLAALGAHVTAVARKPADRARAFSLGLAATDYPGAAAALAAADFIFNTVPAPVLTAELIALTRPECLIIDLASAPGGTDFAAAERLGREAILAPGLPGKVAPLTAGRALARVVIARLAGR